MSTKHPFHWVWWGEEVVQLRGHSKLSTFSRQYKDNLGGREGSTQCTRFKFVIGVFFFSPPPFLLLLNQLEIVLQLPPSSITFGDLYLLLREIVLLFF